MTDANQGRWDFWIDRGGTFTDVVARDPRGRLEVIKLLSHSDAYPDAVTEGIRRALGTPSAEPIPANTIGTIKMGTTIATNALLERRGARVIMLVTRGFKDALRIGNQTRREIFAKAVDKPTMLYERVVEIDERILADGTIAKALSPSEIHATLKAAKSDGFDAVAILFMHAWAYPTHETVAAAIAAEVGFGQISASHDVAPSVKLVERGDTTVVDAYLSPILRRYIDRIGAEVSADRRTLYFMQSSGGLTAANRFRGKDAILSGPAGGVIAAVETAHLASFDRIIGFDMGGTSTDVSHFGGTIERDLDAEIAGVRMRVPMMRIRTIAAGGGSILRFHQGRYQVGPDSAGADPGPAAYRAGGPLTVTDANLMVGKLLPGHFPKVFGKHRDEALDGEVVRSGFARLAAKIGDGRKPEQVADGFLQITVANMANAIRKISVQRGHDVTQCVLNSYGGAAGQHACMVANALNMTRILFHPLSGVLSAYGMGLAPITANRSKAIELRLDAESRSEAGSEKSWARVVADLTDSAVKALSEHRAKAGPAITAIAHLRYEGADATLPVTILRRAPIDAVIQGRVTPPSVTEFERAHRARFGFSFEDKPIIVEVIEVEASIAGAPIDETERPLMGVAAEPSRLSRLFSSGTWHDALVFIRSDLHPGQAIEGPALIIEPNQTIVVELGWRADITGRNHIVLARAVSSPAAEARSVVADPVRLELFNNRFMAIAEEMGIVLQNTAHSVNIKERLDFSCGLFTSAGELIANAPHIPVHLGSMDRSVEAVISNNREGFQPGDAYALNAPYDGGTHLPDITVVSPVFIEDGGPVRFWVASRGHHADIGGLAPGSMTPRATSVEQEGVLIRNFKLVDSGRLREAELVSLLRNHPFPVRNVQQNIADLKAQLAANRRGAVALATLVDEFGPDVVVAYSRYVQDNAEEAVRAVIGSLADAEFTVETDQGATIRASIRVDRKSREATIDFTGTSPQQPNNFNAPEPVTRAAVLYCFRVMAGGAIPLNAGCLRPLNIVIPEGSMLRPTYPAAVAAGNVETSQQVTDCVLGALGAMASSQGTMNNLTFGNDRYQYYETIASGSPAGPGFDGTAGVQTHMTNSRLTDPEVLELRYPVVVEDFHIRGGSGGNGHWSAGDGTERTIRFLEEMDLAILSSHRNVPPHGLAGGLDGEVGATTIRRADGSIDILQGADYTRVRPGDKVTVVTPTGGGYGEPN